MTFNENDSNTIQAPISTTNQSQLDVSMVKDPWMTQEIDAVDTEIVSELSSQFQPQMADLASEVVETQEMASNPFPYTSVLKKIFLNSADFYTLDEIKLINTINRAIEWYYKIWNPNTVIDLFTDSYWKTITLAQQKNILKSTLWLDDAIVSQREALVASHDDLIWADHLRDVRSIYTHPEIPSESRTSNITRIPWLSAVEVTEINNKFESNTSFQKTFEDFINWLNLVPYRNIYLSDAFSQVLGEFLKENWYRQIDTTGAFRIQWELSRLSSGQPLTQNIIAENMTNSSRRYSISSIWAVYTNTNYRTFLENDQRSSLSTTKPMIDINGNQTILNMQTISDDIKMGIVRYGPDKDDYDIVLQKSDKYTILPNDFDFGDSSSYTNSEYITQTSLPSFGNGLSIRTNYVDIDDHTGNPNMNNTIKWYHTIDYNGIQIPVSMGANGVGTFTISQQGKDIEYIIKKSIDNSEPNSLSFEKFDLDIKKISFDIEQSELPWGNQNNFRIVRTVDIVGGQKVFLYKLQIKQWDKLIELSEDIYRSNQDRQPWQTKSLTASIDGVIKTFNFELGEDYNFVETSTMIEEMTTNTTDDTWRVFAINYEQQTNECNIIWKQESVILNDSVWYFCIDGENTFYKIEKKPEWFEITKLDTTKTRLDALGIDIVTTTIPSENNPQYHIWTKAITFGTIGVVSDVSLYVQGNPWWEITLIKKTSDWFEAKNLTLVMGDGIDFDVQIHQDMYGKYRIHINWDRAPFDIWDWTFEYAGQKVTIKIDENKSQIIFEKSTEATEAREHKQDYEKAKTKMYNDLGISIRTRFENYNSVIQLPDESTRTQADYEKQTNIINEIYNTLVSFYPIRVIRQTNIHTVFLYESAGGKVGFYNTVNNFMAIATTNDVTIEQIKETIHHEFFHLYKHTWNFFVDLQDADTNYDMVNMMLWDGWTRWLMWKTNMREFVSAMQGAENIDDLDDKYKIFFSQFVENERKFMPFIQNLLLEYSRSRDWNPDMVQDFGYGQISNEWYRFLTKEQVFQLFKATIMSQTSNYGGTDIEEWQAELYSSLLLNPTKTMDGCTSYTNKDRRGRTPEMFRTLYVEMITWCHIVFDANGKFDKFGDIIAPQERRQEPYYTTQEQAQWSDPESSKYSLQLFLGQAWPEYRNGVYSNSNPIGALNTSLSNTTIVDGYGQERFEKIHIDDPLHIDIVQKAFPSLALNESDININPEEVKQWIIKKTVDELRQNSDFMNQFNKNAFRSYLVSLNPNPIDVEYIDIIMDEYYDKMVSDLLYNYANAVIIDWINPTMSSNALGNLAMCPEHIQNMGYYLGSQQLDGAQLWTIKTNIENTITWNINQIFGDMKGRIQYTLNQILTNDFFYDTYDSPLSADRIASLFQEFPYLTSGMFEPNKITSYITKLYILQNQWKPFDIANSLISPEPLWESLVKNIIIWQEHSLDDIIYNQQNRQILQYMWHGYHSQDIVSNATGMMTLRKKIQELKSQDVWVLSRKAHQERLDALQNEYNDRIKSTHHSDMIYWQFGNEVLVTDIEKAILVMNLGLMKYVWTHSDNVAIKILYNPNISLAQKQQILSSNNDIDLTELSKQAGISITQDDITNIQTTQINWKTADQWSDHLNTPEYQSELSKIMYEQALSMIPEWSEWQNIADIIKNLQYGLITNNANNSTPQTAGRALGGYNGMGDFAWESLNSQDKNISFDLSTTPPGESFQLKIYPTAVDYGIRGIHEPLRWWTPPSAIETLEVSVPGKAPIDFEYNIALGMFLPKLEDLSFAHITKNIDGSIGIWWRSPFTIDKDGWYEKNWIRANISGIIELAPPRDWFASEQIINIKRKENEDSANDHSGFGFVSNNRLDKELGSEVVFENAVFEWDSLFDSWKYELKKEAQESIRQALIVLGRQVAESKLEPNPSEDRCLRLFFDNIIKDSKKISIIWHTDQVWDENPNMQLSIDRANAVKQYILSLSGDKYETIDILISVIWKWEDDLLPRNTWESNDDYNKRCRRIEFQFAN